jgi:hypothetical protein
VSEEKVERKAKGEKNQTQRDRHIEVTFAGFQYSRRR